MNASTESALDQIAAMKKFAQEQHLGASVIRLTPGALEKIAAEMPNGWKPADGILGLRVSVIKNYPKADYLVLS